MANQWITNKKEADHFVSSLKINYDVLCTGYEFDGFVYVMSCNEFYKIGIAKDISKRYYQLATASPYEIKIVCSKKVRNCRRVENMLHLALKHSWIKGEWFKLDELMLYVVKQLLEKI